MPTVATRGQDTPKELFTGSLHQGKQEFPSLTLGPLLESSSFLSEVTRAAGNPGA